METFAETSNFEKYSSKLHVHMRRSSAYPSHNNVSSANTYRMKPTHNHKININQVPRLTTDIIQAAIFVYKSNTN
ncbi:unnamed protein product [Adineta steineri]|uniref:Uncharacterized protein n=1 Tax=Adineta steineri TaxID=433720 RepID=A0A819BYZ7_9BILA|nr:unnamed protein product [Adineta steineri]CAF3809065.1 unnamed protein product [Adineta steineri]